MKLLLLVAALAIVSTVVKGQANLYRFNCNLIQDPATRCSGATSGTCEANGRCTCIAPAAGMNCDKAEGNLNAGDCATEVCQNGGVCYDDNPGDATVQCDCLQQYAGANCQNLRVVATCVDDGANPAVQTGVTFNIYPYAYFDAGSKIYATTSTDPTACQSTGDPNGLHTLSVDNTGNVACGDAASPSAGVFRRCVYLTYSPLALLNGIDYIICATCPNPGDIITKTATLTINEVDANLNTVDLGGAADADASMTLEQGGNAVASGSEVVFGSDITVVYTLLQPGIDKGFTSLFVESCTAQNGENPGVVATMPILTAGCPADRTRVWIGLTSAFQSLTVRTLSFKVFVLQQAPAELMLSCDIRLCRLETDCAMADCGVDQGAGRKKRQVTAGETEEKRLAAVVRVVDPYDTPSQTQTGDKEEKACYMSWQMTATIVALSVGLLLVLLLCVILVVKIILNRRGTETVYRDGSATTSTASLPHLPTIVSNKC